MPRKMRRRDRYTVMRFVLWALAQERIPSPADISGVLDIGLDAARMWRKDWLEARAPHLQPTAMDAPVIERGR